MVRTMFETSTVIMKERGFLLYRWTLELNRLVVKTNGAVVPISYEVMPPVTGIQRLWY